MVQKLVGRNINKVDEATTTLIGLNSSTATTILAAQEFSDAPLLAIYFCNTSAAREIWIKLQPASVDNLKVGICLDPGDWIAFTSTNMYIGEYSAIAAAGNPDVAVVTY
jgi:hypothetical protein